VQQWKYIVNGVAQSVQVVAIDGYPIISGSTMPSSLAESACFVNPNSITGTGQLSLTVNITPPHPLSNKLSSGHGRLAGGGSAAWPISCCSTILDPSGTLNPGTISVNGQREFANYFSLNGSDTEEDVNAGTSVIPNLDSIAEFRIVTSNFDAEYGEFSGGQISVITNSGTNQFHGNAFDFLRNTALMRAITSRLPVAPSTRTSLVEPLAVPSVMTRSSSSSTIRELGKCKTSIPEISA